MSNNRPKITDKIRFWEEQDKINNALIPRVLQIHENQKKQLALNSSLTEDLSKFKLSIANLFESVNSNLDSINELNSQLKKVSDNFDTSLKSFKSDIENLNSKNSTIQNSIHILEEASKNQLSINSNLTDDLKKLKYTTTESATKLDSLAKNNAEILDEIKSKLNLFSDNHEKNITKLKADIESLDSRSLKMQSSHQDFQELLEQYDTHLNNLLKIVQGIKIQSGKLPIYISILAILIAIISFIF